jgi:hypothetical protein
MGNQDLIEIAGKVFDVDSFDVVAKFGIQLLIRMYGGFEFETLTKFLQELIYHLT